MGKWMLTDPEFEVVAEVNRRGEVKIHMSPALETLEHTHRGCNCFVIVLSTERSRGTAIPSGQGLTAASHVNVMVSDVAMVDDRLGIGAPFVCA